MFYDIKEQNLNFKVFMGFDGFVDKILKPVKIKTRETAVAFKTMEEFSDYIREKAGKSCSIDLEVMQEKIGGNMPIVANALATLGCQTICVGAMGIPEIRPVFREMSRNCTLISVSEPGYCSALEFEDGKLMLATNSTIDGLDYEKLISGISEDRLIRYFCSCDAVTFLNWGELLCSNDIWGKILTEIMPKCEFPEKKIMLVDFSDFSKRSDSEVMKMKEILRGFAQYFNITVSLNENELELFFSKLDFPNENTYEDKIIALSRWFTCENFVVHLLDSSCYVKDKKVYTVDKKVVKKPKIITGGGDNFNAGLLAGLLLGFDIYEAIRLGSAMSCLYVENGKEVELKQLVNYDY